MIRRERRVTELARMRQPRLEFLDPSLPGEQDTEVHPRSPMASNGCAVEQYLDLGLCLVSLIHEHGAKGVLAVMVTGLS